MPDLTVVPSHTIKHTYIQRTLGIGCRQEPRSLIDDDALDL